jgi:lactoylglutathione lyase
LGKERRRQLLRAFSQAAMTVALINHILTVRRSSMRLLHTMIRVNNLDESLKFYCDALGMKLMRKHDYPNGEFTLAFVGYGDERDNTVIELTHNWGQSKYDMGNAFGHLAVGTDHIYRACAEFKQKGVKVVREPGPMKFGGPEIAFIEDPNGYKIELIQTADRR